MSDEEFISEVVDTIAAPKINPAFRNIRTLTVVVDGLSIPKENGSAIKLTEGLSVMTYAGEDMISMEGGMPTGVKFNMELAPPNSNDTAIEEPRRMLEVTLPVSNTLFRNGMFSTVVVGDWTRSYDDTFGASEFWPTGTCSVKCPRITYNLSESFAPLRQLTQPKRIVSALGNIVRQLEGPSGTGVPASEELEQSVVEQLKAMGLSQQVVAVWALVIPEEVMAKYDSTSSIGSPLQKELLDLVMRGKASMHRVLSGGGGWGAKAGLLSLDPNNVMESSTPEYDFSALPAELAGDANYAVDEKAKALGDIARPGSFVSFYIGLVGLNGLKGDAIPKPMDGNTNMEGRPAVVLGCAQSTIDDIPSPLQAAGEHGPDSNGLTLVRDRFLAMSEAGLFLRTKEESKDAEGNVTWNVVKTSKIDIPGASICAQQS